MNEIIERIDLDKIYIVPANRRIGGYDEAKLAQLAESIKAVGVQEPAVVRKIAEEDPRAKKGFSFELVAGARRLKASSLAGLVFLPCVVRDLDDAAALRIRLIENLHREDIHPLDEAAGYEELQELGGYDVELIAQEVGRSPAYVYQRLRLLNLVPEAKKLLLEDKISTAHAVHLARLGKDQQIWVIKEFLVRASWRHCTAAELGEWIQRNVLMQLSLATWKLDDSTLLPEAGACNACAKRSGAAPALFADLNLKKDHCLDRACFELKGEAMVARRQEELAGMEHLEVKAGWQGSAPSKGVVGPGEWVECKKKDEGAVRALVVEGDAPGRLTYGRLVKTPAGRSIPTAEEKATRELERKKLKAREETSLRLFSSVLDKIDELLVSEAALPLELYRLIVRDYWSRVWGDHQAAISKRRGWGKPARQGGWAEQGEERIEEMDQNDLLLLSAECLLSGALKINHYNATYIPEEVAAAAKVFGLDPEKVRGEVHTELGLPLEATEAEPAGVGENQAEEDE